MIRRLILISLVLILHQFHLTGQAGRIAELNNISPYDSLYIEIETTRGNEYSGMVISSNEEYLELETEPMVYIRISILKVRNYMIIDKKNLVSGEYYFKNPHGTRYFYGPNGYGLEKNGGYYQNLWVLFNQVSYGITNNLSMGVGVIPLFLFAGASTPVWVTPKVSIPVIEEKLNIGAGVLASLIVGEETHFGIAYGTCTYGGRNKNATLGMGWAYSGDGWGQYPTFSLSGMYRIGQKGYLLTENYLISTPYESIGIFSLGGRTVQKRLAVDYGLVIPVNTGVFLAIPWLSITLPFGGND